MFGWHGRKTTRGEPGGRASPDKLVAEAETILSGRLALSPLVHKYGTGWAFINALAHANWDTLCSIINGTRPGEGRGWDSALVFLADELLSAARDPDDLLRIQRAHLVPLELDILRGATPRPMTAPKLVDLVRPRLAQAHDARRGGAGLPPPVR